MSTHSYEYTYIYPIYISTFEKLGRLNIRIYEVNQRISYCRWDVIYH
jgi:hypothetical protein